MATKKHRIDSEYTRLLGNHMMNAKGFYDYGVKRGLTTPEALRLTVAKRKETVGVLKDSGMSERKIAKAVNASRATVRRDIGRMGQKGPKNGPKRPKGNGSKKPDTSLDKTSVAAISERLDEIAGDTPLRSLFEQADANGGVIYVEVSGYGVRVKKITC